MKSRYVSLMLALSVVLMVLIVTPALAAAATVDITVVDAETGSPVENTAVQLHQVAPPAVTPIQHTNASGYVGFSVPMTVGSEYFVTAQGPTVKYVPYQTSNFTYTGVDVDVAVPIWQRAHRVWGPDRYTTAVETARTAFGSQQLNQWPNIPDVVIASGEEYAAADPLTAAGICWCYDAPLLLVGRDHTPSSVKKAVAELVAATGHVTIHVVGGPESVPQARYQDLVNYVGGPSKLTLDRVGPYSNRYELASSVAARVKHISDTTPKTMENIALIANGADPTKFFDALALSPITAQNGAPILLVAEDSVPWQTSSRLAALSVPSVIVGGGPATVSAKTYAKVGATERWWGADRYETAVEIASMATTQTLLGTNRVGVAAKLPDALTGGAATGMMNGTLVLTKTDAVPKSTYAFVESCG